MPSIVVTVSGGIVQDVTADSPTDVRVYVADFDNPSLAEYEPVPVDPVQVTATLLDMNTAQALAEAGSAHRELGREIMEQQS